MPSEGRTDSEGFRRPCEIPEADEVPIVLSPLSDSDLVTGNMEGGALPAVGRLNLNQSLGAVRFEAQDIIAEPIAVFLAYPAYLTRQVRSSRNR